MYSRSIPRKHRRTRILEEEAASRVRGLKLSLAGVFAHIERTAGLKSQALQLVRNDVSGTGDSAVQRRLAALRKDAAATAGRVSGTASRTRASDAVLDRLVRGEAVSKGAAPAEHASAAKSNTAQQQEHDEKVEEQNLLDEMPIRGLLGHFLALLEDEKQRAESVGVESEARFANAVEQYESAFAEMPGEKALLQLNGLRSKLGLPALAAPGSGSGGSPAGRRRGSIGSKQEDVGQQQGLLGGAGSGAGTAEDADMGVAADETPKIAGAGGAFGFGANFNPMALGLSSPPPPAPVNGMAFAPPPRPMIGLAQQSPAPVFKF